MEQINEIMRFCAELRPIIDNIDGQALKTAMVQVYVKLFFKSEI